jgi:hypothetical protein
LFDDCDESFNTHLNVIKGLFCNPKKIGVVEDVVTKVLCGSTLNVLKSMFKFTMKNNAQAALGLLHSINPLTKMWKIITNFIILFCEISKCVKLVKIAMVQVLGLVEDEKNIQ